MSQKPIFHLSINSRLAYLTLGVFFISGVVIARLFYLQVFQYNEFLNLARNQQQSSSELLPGRGTIYFREDKTGKLITAAITQKEYLLFIDMQSFKGTDSVFELINKITPIDKTLYNSILKKNSDPYEVLKQHVTLDEGDALRALHIEGLGLEIKSRRFYPGGTMASHVLGFVSTPSNNIPHGQYGIEKFYESSLQGNENPVNVEKDAHGILLALSQFNVSFEGGKDIVLTIEPSIQRAVEAELLHLQNLWHPIRGGIVIVEPKTGKIRAMGAFPAFNPNEFYKENNLSVFLNPFVEKIFEMGSVFKPLTMAAALDRGVVSPTTTYTDYGQVTLNGRMIKNYDGKARGVQTMTQVLDESLNTGAIFAMQKLGTETFKQYFLHYGLTEKTGIDLPGEISGNWNNVKSGREVEFATAAFGQGIAVSPLELTMALSSIANGGELLKPYVNETNQRTVIRRVLQPEGSQKITQMLVQVVDVALLGGKIKKPGYSIAAKTGTAQVLDVNGGRGYSKDEYLHSFFGYFPAYDPRFLIFMFLERPQGAQYASHSLTDSFNTLVDFLINYYTIPPDRN